MSLICKLGVDTLQPEHALKEVERLSSVFLETLVVQLEGDDPIQHVRNMFGSAEAIDVQRFLIQYAYCLISCNHGNMANRLLLAAIGLYPSDFNGLQPTEAQVASMLSGDGGDPSLLAYVHSISSNIGNWPYAASVLGNRDRTFPGVEDDNLIANLKLLAAQAKSIGSELSRLWGGKRSLAFFSPSTLPDDDRIDFCFALSSTFIAVGRPLVGLKVCIGALHRSGVDPWVPDDLKGADETELYSIAFMTLFPRDRFRQISLGAHLVAILQGTRGHPQARKILFALLGLADLEGKRHPRNRIRLVLEDIRSLSVNLAVTVADQLRLALEASHLRGSARFVLEELDRLVSQLPSGLSPHVQFELARLKSYERMMAGKPRDAIEILEQHVHLSGSATSHSHGTERGIYLPAHKPVTERHVDLLVAAYQASGRMDDAERLQVRLLQLGSGSSGSSPVSLNWSSLNSSRYSDLACRLADPDAAPINKAPEFGPPIAARVCRLVSQLASLLLESGAPEDAFAVLRLLQHEKADLSVDFPGIRAAQFPIAITAAAQENSYIPWLRFSQLFSMAAGRAGFTDDGARLLESFMSPSQSLREFPDTWWLKDLQAPEKIQHVLTWIALAKESDPDLFAICDAIVEQVREIAAADIHGYANREAFWRQLQGLRNQVLSAGLTLLEASRGASTIATDELCRKISEWLEQLDNRILLEECILKDAAEWNRREENWPPARTVVSNPIWVTSNAWELVIKADQTEYNAWLRAIRNYSSSPHAISANSVTTHVPPDETTSEREPESIENLYLDIDEDVTQRYAELLREVSQPRDLETLLHPGQVWMRSVFDNHGRLFWWAFSKIHGDSGIHFHGLQVSDACAEDVILTANLEAQACLEAVWHVVKQHRGLFRADPKAAHEERGRWHDFGSRISAVLGSSHIRSPFVLDPKDVMFLSKNHLPRVLALLREIGKECNEADGVTKKMQRLIASWERCLRIVTARIGDDSLLRWKDDALNDICSRQLSVCSYFFDLSTLQLPPATESASAITFTVEGPLLSIPLAWLPFAGQPVFLKADSVSTVLSLTLQSVTKARRVSGSKFSSVFCGLWEQPLSRHSSGFPILWRGVRSWTERNGSAFMGYCDDPALTPNSFVEATRSQTFDVAVLACHGVDGGSAIEFSGGAFGSPAAQWRGEGSFNPKVLFVLLSCSVGRLRQSSITEVHGLYSRILANGGCNVVAPKWDVDDCYGSVFLLEFLDELEASQGRRQDAGIAFNKARKKAWGRYLSVLETSEAENARCHHAISAFEYYGRS
jgi:hypothetical protein